MSTHTEPDESAGSAPAVRLDVWLDVACLFRTRSEAKRACEGGKVDVNGQPGKPHRLVRAGDQLRITRSDGRRQEVGVRGVAERSIPKAEARLLYEDRTPPLPPEEIDRRRSERLFRATTPMARPRNKKERRALREFRGR